MNNYILKWKIISSYGRPQHSLKVLLLNIVLMSCTVFSMAVTANVSKKDAVELAAIITSVRSIEVLAEMCEESNKPYNRKAYKAWREKNFIDKFNLVFKEKYMQTRQDRVDLAKTDKKLRRVLSPALTSACRKLPDLASQDRYNIATHHRVMMEKLGVPGQSRTSTGTNHRSSNPRNIPNRMSTEDYRRAKEISESIVNVGFRNIWRIQVTGGATFGPSPVIMFRDGTACTDMGLLSSGLTISQYRKNHPKRFTQWRRSWGKLQLKKKGEWRELSYDKEYPPLETGQKLEGRYKRLTSGGSAMGSGGFYANTNSYQFFDNGRFVQARSVYSTYNGGNGATSISSLPPNVKGTYNVNGYLLALNYDNGEKVLKAIVLNKEDADAIWLDGYSYTR